MDAKTPSLFRIEANYAGVQSFFWLGNLAYNGFTAVLLSSKGFSDAQIGLTSGVLCVLSILFQLITSSYSDRRHQVPIKRIISVLLAAAMACAALIMLFPLPFFLLMMVFAIGGGFQSTNVGLINAEIMQYINVGLPVNFGWPRGIGSLVYATAAFTLGRLMETYSPDMLLPIYLVSAVVTMFILHLMPPVPGTDGRSASPYVRDKNSMHTTYRDMLTRNRVLLFFLLAGILLNFGQAPSSLFLVRVVTSVGGGGRELGVSMLLQSGVEMPIMFLTPLILKKVRVSRVLMFSFGMYTVKMLLLRFAGTLPAVYAAMAVSVFCYGLYGVCSSYFVNLIAKNGEKVRAQALVILAGNLGNILGNLMAGIILDRMGLPALLSVSWKIILMAAIMMFFCLKAEQKSAARPAAPGLAPGA